jgi:hypothetical protein
VNLPFRTFFNHGNREKLGGEKFREYGAPTRAIQVFLYSGVSIFVIKC